ncbi:tail collar protein [Nostoc phage A1]|uniref:Tail collar protein n=1 Tax=Nostoc phage A1 TaxID=1775256 RepID=A0ACD6B8X3_9CAUD|nr:tail collar protein [Nostoc phage A1]
MVRKVFNDGDILYAEDVNIIGQPFVDGQDLLGHGLKVDDNSLSDEPQNIKTRFYAWYNRFRVTVQSGLTLSVTQGSISVSGNIISFPPQTINAIDNANSFVWIGKTDADPAIALRVSQTLPNVCIPLARVIAASGSVTSVTDLRDVSVDILPPSIPDAVPVGSTIISLIPPTAPIPAGYLELLNSSQNVSRTTYSALFALWGTYYGNGDGSTTFGVPGTGGRFLRLGGSGLSVGDIGGSNQITIPTNALPSHQHGIPANTHTHSVNDGGHGHTINQTPHSHSISDPGHAHGVPFGAAVDNGNNAFDTGGSPYNNGIGTTQNQTGISVNTANANLSINTSSTGISIQSASTGLTVTSNAGNGQAFQHDQPYLVFRVFVKV